MKTVKEIAKEYNVSVQAIYKHLNLPLNLPLNQSSSLKVKKGNITYITPAGEEYFKLNLIKRLNEPLNQNLEGSNRIKLAKWENRLIKIQEERVLYLESEIAKQIEINAKNTERIFELTKDMLEQSKTILELTKDLSEITKNGQLLLGAEQSRTNPVLLTGESVGDTGQPEPAEPVKKWGFFNIFKKR